tara:strand:- start:9 stop:320 length:312 start_codon:yes stop_codon:yes gene_type:complete
MVAVKDIIINLSVEDNRSKAILDFSPIANIVKGDSIYLSVKESNIGLTVETDTSLSAWLDWIVSNYNLLSDSDASLERDGSNIIILGSNSDDLELNLDLGQVN